MRQVREHPQCFLSLDTGGECRGGRSQVAAVDLCCSLYNPPQQPAVLSCCTAASNCDEKGAIFNYNSNLEAGQALKDHTAYSACKTDSINYRTNRPSSKTHHEVVISHLSFTVSFNLTTVLKPNLQCHKHLFKVEEIGRLGDLLFVVVRLSRIWMVYTFGAGAGQKQHTKET